MPAFPQRLLDFGTPLGEEVDHALGDSRDFKQVAAPLADQAQAILQLRRKFGAVDRPRCHLGPVKRAAFQGTARAPFIQTSVENEGMRMKLGILSARGAMLESRRDQARRFFGASARARTSHRHLFFEIIQRRLHGGLLRILQSLARGVVGLAPQHGDGFGRRKSEIPTGPMLAVLALLLLNQRAVMVRVKTGKQARELHALHHAHQPQLRGGAAMPAARRLPAVEIVVLAC